MESDPRLRRLAACLILDAWVHLHTSSERQAERREEARAFVSGTMAPWAGLLGLRPETLREALVESIRFVCVVEGCGRPSLRSGLTAGKSMGEGWLFCRTHLHQWKEGHAFTVNPRAANRSCALPCKVEGCDDLVEALGLCNRHYRQQLYRKRNGLPSDRPYDGWAGLKREGGIARGFAKLPPLPLAEGDAALAADLEALTGLGTPVGDLTTSLEGIEG